ncbi:hypothetical protein J4206_06330 [Candidatus Woesearchaeota archaeon]|nr:hypothetical protein [Candidatus Woesearchaeota archaeon]
MGKYLVDNSRNNDWLSSHVALHKKVAGEAQAIAAKIKQLNLLELSDNQLSFLYADLMIKAERFNALSMEIDALDLVLEEELKKAISSTFAAKREQNEAYTIITTPSELSAPKKEELMFYRLALTLKETKKYDDKLINSILSDFWWTELNWRAGDGKTLQTIKKGIDNILKEAKDIPKHIRKLENYSDEIVGLKKKYLKNPELNVLNNIFEEYALLHELRKETQMKATFSLYLIFEEISKRFGISVNDLEVYSPDELILLLEKERKISDEEIANRLQCSTLFINENGCVGNKNDHDNNSVLFKSGEDAIKLKASEQSKESDAIRDFSGLPASLGKAVGRVKIALSAAEALKKIEKGDILVTGMTMPDFVPAMKKAAAIITNEGGATCHAAIISREFNIPCIVGTKIATKILKDGMMVEVNANHGVVKIIK